MKIKKLQITSSTLDLELDVNKSVCFLRGRHSDLVLDLIRELIGDRNSKNDPDQYNDGHFVIHSDIEIDSKNYSVCYIRNADFMGDNRIAANFLPNSLEYPKDDTIEFIDKCKARNTNLSNILYNSFVTSNTTDDRPLFIYGLEKKDEVAIHTILNKFEKSGRQVFVSVSKNYPHEQLNHSLVQVCDLSIVSRKDDNDAIADVISAAIRGEFGNSELPEVGARVDDIYTVILCPVCNKKALDNHSICCHCGWEYDGIPNNYYSTANGATIDVYREKYRKVMQSFGGKEHV